MLLSEASELQHDKNQQDDLCAQQRLRLAWASFQSDQCLRCPSEESLGPWLPFEHTVKTLIRLMHRLIRVFVGRTGHFVGFVMLWLKFGGYVFTLHVATVGEW